MTLVSPPSDPAEDRRRIPSPPHLGASLRTQAARDVVSEPGVRRWRAFALLVVAYFMTIVDLTIVNVALPTIGVKLHFPESDLQWVVTAYGLTFGGFLLLGGRAADLLGRRRLLMVGLAVFSAASLACGLATSDTFLIIMRGFQGLGAAIVLPAALSIVMNMFPEGAERNKALGSGGQWVPWGPRSDCSPAACSPATSAGSTSSSSTCPSGRLPWPWRPRSCPRAGSAQSGVATTHSARRPSPRRWWCSSMPSRRRRRLVGPATQTVAMLTVAAALLGAFFVIETRVEAPLLPLRLFRLSTVAGSNAVGFLLTGSFYTFIFIGTLYMQQVLGFSALKTGLAWLTASVTALAFAGLSQKLVTKTSPKRVMVIRDGAHRSRHLVGHPDSAARELLAGLGRTVLRGGHRRRICLHPRLDRSPHRGHRARRRSGLWAHQHVAAARWRHRSGGRLVHRRLSLPHAGSSRLRHNRLLSPAGSPRPCGSAA